MRRRVYLYLGTELVDLDDESFVLLNYKREDLSSPAAVINSWSQGVKLPNTDRNATALGHYYRLDRRTTGTGGSTGPQYNALKRTPFSIYDTTGALLQSGYFRLDKVTDGTYEISLFGGLGGLFYGLTYDGAGNKLTLADLSYSYAGNPAAAATAIDVPCTRISVLNAWAALRNGAPASGSVYDILNFAPCLNGTEYPFKFDTNKFVVAKGSGNTETPNIEFTKTSGGHTYGGIIDPGDLSNTNRVLVETGNKHNEWEAQDLRTYCQRPVINTLKLLEAIRHYAGALGYTLNFDTAFYTPANPYCFGTWITLPFLNRDKLTPAQLAALKLSGYLTGTATPADYLLAIAKTFGFVFRTAEDGTSITMIQRDNYYQFGAGTVIDLQERIDRSREISVQPFRISSHYYEFVPDVVDGAFAQDYLERYGAKYGRQLVDTGYDFNGDRAEVLKDVLFQGCADVRDRRDYYHVLYGNVVYFGRLIAATSYAFKFVGETAKYQLFWVDPDDPDATDRDIQSLDCAPINWSAPDGSYGNPDGYHWLNLPQMHDAEGKATDGSGVMLFFVGQSIPPVHSQGGHTLDEAIFHLSDDPSVITNAFANNGVPCWSYGRAMDNIQEVSWVPSFRRCHFNGSTMDLSLDFGDPLERATNGSFTAGVNLWSNYWEAYITDRLDADTLVVRCWVNLEGLQVGEDLLRRLYYFDGAQWTLNAIENHSLTTFGPTLCEFIKVNSVAAYTAGQYQQ